MTGPLTDSAAMTFITDYLQVVDIVAIVALVLLACAAFIRSEGFWLGLLGVVVVVWAASRLLHLF